jgi:large repetitive protein
VDVISLGETDLFIGDGKLQLMVNGKDGDSVNLSNSHVAGLSDGEWRAHETVHIGAAIYNVVEHSSANVELLVEREIRIDMS